MDVCKVSDLVEEVDGGVGDRGKWLQKRPGRLFIEGLIAWFDAHIQSGEFDTGGIGSSSTFKIAARCFNKCGTGRKVEAVFGVVEELLVPIQVDDKISEECRVNRTN